MALIEPNLYLCSYQQAKSLACKHTNVFIINCTTHLPMCIENGIRIAVDDDGTQESINIMTESLEVILKDSNLIDIKLREGYTVIVHCLAGLQRSPTVIAAYLMQKYKLSVTEAVTLLQSSASYAFLDSIHFENSLYEFARK